MIGHDNDSMREFQRTKFLRLQYPEKLSKEQQLEILAKLPEYPAREYMVTMGLSFDNEFKDPSEYELAQMYAVKLAAGYVKNKGNNNLYSGMVLPTYLWRFFDILSNSMLASKIPFEREKELAKECYDAWMANVPEEHKAEHDKYIRERLDIAYEVNAKHDYYYPDSHKKQRNEAYAFIESLIKPKNTMKIELKNGQAPVEFSEFELKDENLRKIRIHWDNQDAEGLWAYFSDADVKRYDSDARSTVYDAVVVLANAPIMFYPNNFWGAYVPIKLMGSVRGELNVADLEGTPLFHSKRYEAENADTEEDEDEDEDEIPQAEEVEPTPEPVKSITLQTAVALAIRDLLPLGPFSAYDVTQLIRVQVDKDYELSDVFDFGILDDEDGTEFTEVHHDDVKALVVELFDNGLIDATRGYGTKNGNSFVQYTPNVAGTQVATGPIVTPAVGAQPSTSPYLNKIQAYLKEKKSATAKQIQSALKVQGLYCEDILRILGLDPAKEDAPSKVLLRA